MKIMNAMTDIVGVTEADQLHASMTILMLNSTDAMVSNATWMSIAIQRIAVEESALKIMTMMMTKKICGKS